MEESLARGHTLLDRVKQLIRYERLILTNLHNADIEAQAEEARAYLKNGAEQ